MNVTDDSFNKETDVCFFVLTAPGYNKCWNSSYSSPLAGIWGFRGFKLTVSRSGLWMEPVHT